MQEQALLHAIKTASSASLQGQLTHLFFQVIYLVVRFPGASFASPEEDSKQSEFTVTAGEQSVMRTSRITLRGTVTIPLPERDVHRFVCLCACAVLACLFVLLCLRNDGFPSF